MTDEEIIDFTIDTPFTQSEYQNRYFVTEGYLTPVRKLRQAITELNMRIVSLADADRAVRKVKWKKQEVADNIENEKYEPQKEMLKIDFEKFELEERKYIARKKGIEFEYNTFLKIIRELCEEYNLNPKELNLNENFDEDRKYWIMRIAKQCALDIACTGRITSANLDAVLSMGEDDYSEVLVLANRYSQVISHKVNRCAEIAMNSNADGLLESAHTSKFIELYNDSNI